MTLKNSELILNSDGSVYHLNLKPENISDTILFVGDQNRVEEITNHFDSIEFSTQKREFKTQTGYLNGKRISVLSTGIGPDNIDIVINELDALVNIDLKTRKVKQKIASLNIIRVGTSAAIQKEIPLDSILLSTHGLDINGMLHFYNLQKVGNPELENAFIEHTKWSADKSKPLFIENSKKLQNCLESDHVYNGVTSTVGGFYGPQGRVLRLALADSNLNAKLQNFYYKGFTITNFEMETSAIYGLSKLLGHHACSLNAIIANRATGEVSANPELAIRKLIDYTLNKLT